MTAQVETLSTIQPWRQGNYFNLTLRGHWQRIPEETSVDTSNNSSYDEQIQSVIGTTNYNTVFDSFYAPVDFKLSGITVRMPRPLPQNSQLEITLSVNGGVLEKFSIPEFEDHNMKQYELDCDFLIYEDDFLELSVSAQEYDSLEFNENNIVVSLSGCVSYLMYKELWADEIALVATTANITLSGTQTIDGVDVVAGDIVLVKEQTTSSENGLYVVSTGSWSRHASYSSVDSLEDVVIYISSGTTNNSDDMTNLTAIEDDDGEFSFGYPLMEWEEGDNWYKTNIHLQNRSGNDTLLDSVSVDMIRSPLDFLFQGIRFSIFRDDLIVVERFREKVVCIYLDVLVNGQSILPYTDFPRPLQIDMSQTYQSYDMTSFDNSSGYPIHFGDMIDIRVYLRNESTKYNGKLINMVLYGCAPDCATFDSPVVAVYQPCEETPCVWKFTVIDKCEPETLRTIDSSGNAIGDAAYDANSGPTIVDAPQDEEYMTTNNTLVTIDGEIISI